MVTLLGAVRKTAGVSTLMLPLLGAGELARAGLGESPTLRIMTFNVWHGLRGEARMRLRGEDPERKQRRFDWQIELIRRLDPDVLLLQEVNPNSRESRAYAEALGFDHIEKVTNCGLHLPPIKIPCNMNEGLTILARRGLGLEKVGKKRLSGDARCTASFGIQTRESRFVLFGEIVLAGRKLLLATTHLSSPAKLPEQFDSRLSRLVEERRLTAEQRDEFLAAVQRKQRRNLDETQGILRQIERQRARVDYDGVVLTGDFNTEPDTAPILTLEQTGLRNVTDDPAFHTFDPLINRENHAIGARRTPPLPTFGVAELERLLAEGAGEPRQIDYIFVSRDLLPLAAEMVMDQSEDGLYPSDHFGLLAVVRVDGSER